VGAKVGGGASGATSRLTTSGKEAKTVNPNGFPIGEHNNLNILGNNDDSLANSYATTRETLFTATSSLYR